jgi:hypothetical protein
MDRAYSADVRSVYMWDLGKAGAKVAVRGSVLGRRGAVANARSQEAAKVTPDAVKPVTAIAVDPVRAQQVAVVVDSDVQVYDFRSGKYAFAREPLALR